MFFGGGGFPFGDEDDDPFAHMRGGMGGRGGPPKEVENSKLYEILKVSKTATLAEIKSSYKKTSLKGGEWAHPDKGGDPEKFK